MRGNLNYRRRNPYNTRSNRVKIVRTPGGELRYLHIKKKGTIPKCGDTGVPLQGVAALRPREYSRAPKSQRRVQRIYGGTLSANAVKNRIIQAFLVEEHRVVKAVLKKQAEKDGEAKPKTK